MWSHDFLVLMLLSSSDVGLFLGVHVTGCVAVKTSHNPEAVGKRDCMRLGGTGTSALLDYQFPTQVRDPGDRSK